MRPTEAIEGDVELAPGLMVGEYRVTGKLGAGGMGTVYSAEHPVIAKKAAIKVLHPALSINRGAVQRFVQEARSVNQIGHPNIVDIFSFGVLADGRHYFVMEWLRGESLGERLRRGRVSLSDALAILETITLPLDAAHEVGIVHRDLKPDNVFLVAIKGERPQVMLLDFGIAKLIGTEGMRQTQTGNMMGTPGYMSPEQARAEGVDHRTDIYALGAMAFELVTDSPAFDATNAADMISQHLHQPPRSARAFNPEVPPALDALIVRMLAKRAADRPTLAQVRAELRASRVGLERAGVAATVPPTVDLPVAGTVLGVPAMQMPLATPASIQAPASMQVPIVTPSAPIPATANRRAPRSRAVLVFAILVLLGGAVAVGVRAIGGAEPSRATPVETKPAETKSVEVKPVEVQPETKLVEPPPAEPAHDDAKPAQKPASKKRPRAKPSTGSASGQPFDPDALM